MRVAEAGREEREDCGGRLKAPIQELARLKDEIRMIHGSLKGFDVGRYRSEKNENEENFERDLKKRLGELDEYARRKELENQGTQFPDDRDCDVRKGESKYEKMRLQKIYDDESMGLEKVEKINRKLLDYGKKQKAKVENLEQDKFYLKQKRSDEAQRLAMSKQQDISHASSSKVHGDGADVGRRGLGSTCKTDSSKRKRSLIQKKDSLSRDRVDSDKIKKTVLDRQEFNKSSGITDPSGSKSNATQGSRKLASIKREFLEDVRPSDNSNASQESGPKANGRGLD
jgi:hypothetical protein